MKRTLLAIVATVLMTTTINAQRLTDITAEARFITDKMAVELGLTSVQRDNIMDLNFAYLDGIYSYRDIESHGWKSRNRQIRALLSAAQWKKFKDSPYFYRPISWRDNAYVHNIYGKYPRNGRPTPPPPGIDNRKGKREFNNNSPEAIKMRRDMRHGNRFAR